MNKLALALTLSLTTSTAFSGAYKCQVDGKTVYQQLPCAGQELVLNTKDTGNGGLRESETTFVEKQQKDREKIDSELAKVTQQIHSGEIEAECMRMKNEVLQLEWRNNNGIHKYNMGKDVAVLARERFTSICGNR